MLVNFKGCNNVYKTDEVLLSNMSFFSFVACTNILTVRKLRNVYSYDRVVMNSIVNEHDDWMGVGLYTNIIR